MHAPKDKDRREIELDPEAAAAVRAMASKMVEWGFPLSAGWRQQLGATEEEAAAAAAAAAANPKKRPAIGTSIQTAFRSFDPSRSPLKF